MTLNYYYFKKFILNVYALINEKMFKLS